MNRTWKVALALTVLALLASGRAYAKVNLGDAAPNWERLAGVDGRDHDLAEYRAAKALVLVFTCNHCPVAKAYEERLIELQKDYQAKGVQLVAINVNNLPADRLDRMKERAQEKGFNFPYLYDSSQASGRAYGAQVTPHVFVLDAQRKIAYVGAVDDSQNAGNVKTRYVRDALDALLAGQSPAKAETKAFGCNIKYEKGGDTK
jgi:peroxiredoxin